MCYWEITKLNKRHHFNKWKKPAVRNSDGYGYYCITCNEQYRSFDYPKYKTHLSSHNKHLVVIHFRLQSCGKRTLHNVQPIVMDNYVVAHNGDFSSFARKQDWRDLMGLGFSDSWILAILLAEAWEHDEYETKLISKWDLKTKKYYKTEMEVAVPKSDMDRAKQVLEKMKEISPHDFLANYVFITPELIVSSIGSGDYSEGKEQFYISSGDNYHAQFIYMIDNIQKGHDTPEFFSHDDYSRSWSYNDYKMDWKQYYEEKDNTETPEGSIIEIDGYGSFEVNDSEMTGLERLFEVTDDYDVHPEGISKENGMYWLHFTNDSLSSMRISDDGVLNDYIIDRFQMKLGLKEYLDDVKLEISDLVWEYMDMTGFRYEDWQDIDGELPYYLEVKAR